MRTYTEKVTTKLTKRHWKKLENRAHIVGLTPHQTARRILEECLDRNDDSVLAGLNFLAEVISKLSQQVEDIAQQDAANRHEIAKFKDAMRDEFHNLATVLNER